MKNTILPILILCIFASNALGIDLSADDPIEYNPTNSHLIATGNARLTTDTASIQANKMEYSSENRVASAHGNAIFSNNHVFILADSLDYNLADGIITGSNCNIYSTPIVVNASKLHLEEQYQRTGDGTLYFGQPDDFTPNVSAKNFEILHLREIRAKSIVFRIGKVPFFYLPSLSFTTKEYPFWLKNDYGVQKNLGFFLRNDFYFRTNKEMRIGGLLDVYTNRGLLFGPALEIETKSDSVKIFSESKFGFIHDNGSFEVRNEGINQQPMERRRFFLETKNIAHFRKHVDAVAHLNWWSDLEVTRDFRPSWYKKDQIPDSFLETSYRGCNYLLSAFLRPKLNNFHDTVTKIPELRAEMLPSRLGETNIYCRTYINYAHLQGKDANKQRREADKFDGYFGAYLPLSGSNWFNLSPIAGVRVTEYLKQQNNKNCTRVIAQFGLDTNMLFSGKLDYENEVWNIHGIKHIIQPVIQYRYIPKAEIENTNIPLLETKVFDTNLPIIDLADMRNVDDICPQNMFRVGLKNLLQTSTGGYHARDLLKFDLYQDVRLKRSVDKIRNAKEKTLSDTYILLGLCPVNWLDFDCYARVDPKNMTFNEITASTNIHSGDVWKLSFSAHSLRHYTDQCSLNFMAKLNSRLQMGVALYYDARIKKFTEQRFSICSKLGHSWNVECLLLVRSKAALESKCQFSFKLDLAEF